MRRGRFLEFGTNKRSSMLVNHEEYYKYNIGDNRSLWNLSDCHVLRCKLHCNALDPSKKSYLNFMKILRAYLV